MHRSFRELGLSGGRTMRLRRALAEHTGLTMAGSVLLDHPTPHALARHLEASLLRDGGAAPTGTTDTESGEPAPRDEDETVAVVGMACHYPGGVHGPDDLWRLVDEGTDAITPLPTNRGWDLAALTDTAGAGHNTTYARGGGFLAEPGLFDAEFFGMTDAEAYATDPQQRLLLETSWEVIEHARIDPSSLRGTPTGVFVGVAHQSYTPPLHQEPEEFQGHSMVGSLSSSLSGRVAYALGLEGPALTIDTACSSALVCIHLAAQSLRSGESSLAIAGGVSISSTPGSFAAFSRQRGLAPDGRAKSFSAHADGFALSEGIGLILLERLSDARRNGHPVLAVIRGSAVNQDGTSNGMTAPNAPAQERLIRRALADARLRPDQVDVVEAHSPGTEFGDPIEVRALQATYARDRDPERPLLLGTLKSNIGHSLAAAGAGGIIKMVMAMRHGHVPRTLHVEEPTTKVDWSAQTIRLLARPEPWPETGEPRRAAVSSFGVTGTNGHVIVESPPSEATGAAPSPSVPTPASTRAVAPSALPVPWLLSARTAAGLRDQAVRLRRHMAARPQLSDQDIAFSLATTRARFEQRAVVIARERSALLRGLDALADGTATTELHRCPADGSALDASCVLALDAAGARRAVRDAAHLNQAFPTFGIGLRMLCERAGRTLGEQFDAEELLRTPNAGASDLTDAPRAFLCGLALLELLRDWEVRPDSVAAHQDALALAAHALGALPFTDALRITAARARWAEAGPEERQEAADHLTKLVIELSPRTPRIPLSLTGGEPVTPDDLRDPALWLRTPIPGNPHATGFALELRGTGDSDGDTAEHLPLLPEEPSVGTPYAAENRTAHLAEGLLTALARYEVHIGGVDWGAVLAERGARTVDLPTYPFQRRTYWAPFTVAQEATHERA
ncbi:type I polyketide synthase [Streptomyces ipomoeae]|uniref:type I polyketide synthase n=1 Tax=Streptomyces ipomoeae TaxID=103232 RepID=UPI0015F05648|nr:beta-ketoacyl synthase N-terminal-like domain-containing protein [Streptomyces ipomoeae]MDX2938356.1 beta-ketoacyl synthase N-terminal-like domain-containing protein [Streptomyces ipomoeae]